MAYTIIGGIGVVSTNYSIANPCNIQTLNNVIMLCDDLEIDSPYTAGNALLTLSDSSMFPDTDVIIPVCITENNQTRIEALTINTSGEISLSNNYNSAIVHLNGICFHANSKYYTPAIGNIYNNGSSPLSVI